MIIVLFRDQSAEEAREWGRRGGIASGKARHRKKPLREALEIRLERKAPEAELDGAEEVAFALFEKAKGGDVRAFMALRDTVRERPVAGVDVNASGPITVSWGMTPEEIEDGRRP